jgi:hypothetical protein
LIDDVLSLPLSRELFTRIRPAHHRHCCGWIYYIPSAPENSCILFAIAAARKGRDFKVNGLIVASIFDMLHISRFSYFSPTPSLPIPRVDLIHPPTPNNLPVPFSTTTTSGASNLKVSFHSYHCQIAI